MRIDRSVLTLAIIFISCKLAGAEHTFYFLLNHFLNMPFQVQNINTEMLRDKCDCLWSLINNFRIEKVETIMLYYVFIRSIILTSNSLCGAT